MVLSILQALVLFLFGGTGYSLIELLWRGYTHWSMFITGGLCFVFIEQVNRRYLLQRPLLHKCAAGCLIITGLELMVGCVVNLWLGLAVWDYTDLPLNLFGQISLTYSFLWFVLSAPLSFLCSHVKKRIDLTE